ncbi:E3 SUMO-protein ligase ZBED1-like [Musca domestica]|uniref:E3 SUMO-protein ligase ZBED1-like n=1 Tax=Musca domestica TaxID=7370 RepID=A0ABM3VDB5_MUSDO|nr:E3 SUMO-protein ligase ZBED1-like [Musca domestica]
MNRYLKRPNDISTSISIEETGNENEEERENSTIGGETNKSKRARHGFSEVWNHFQKTTDKRNAKCQLCGKIYKTSGNTSNLLDHLKRSHPSYNQLPKPTKTIDNFFNNSVSYDTESARKKELDKALMSLIATDVQPFSVVEDTGFRDFVRCLDPRYVLPSRNTLKNVLMVNMYNETKSKLQTILNGLQHCAITTDLWTSRANESYPTVTCHFVTKDFVLRTAVLSTKKLLCSTNHNAENISISMRAVLEEWGLMEKVVAVVSDNASSMLKACELLQKRNLPCFAHTINLVVQDCLAQDYVKTTLGKCKKIVSYFKSSTISYEKFKADQGRDMPHSLKQEVPTRWNSALRMVESILLTNNSISNVLLMTPKAPLPLTADDIEFLQDLKQLLMPFDSATVQTSSSAAVTISLVVPLTCGLFKSLDELKSAMKTSEGHQACIFLLERIKKRLFPYEERTVTRLGTLLDPRFKKEGFLFPSNADGGTQFLQNVLSGMNKNNTMEQDNLEPSCSKNIHQSSQPPLLKFVGNKIASKVRSHQVDAIISLRQYSENENAALEIDPLQYWKNSSGQMSLIKSCSLRHLCVPATSTEAERMFSKTGAIISERRSSLKPKNVDMLLFVNKNCWVSKEL